ncbi:hypothetical protein [Algicella marina]|uniref:Uncharacterized protein n=1 Tax=Algicella marina TaxID=2683284 RepID=A0A6P1T3R8_9RHOB|nr:hypothetical protein [Algicella marina]QHQ36116.1 hypothetical protein GO499_13525 [Algicella marina]
MSDVKVALRVTRRRAAGCAMAIAMMMLQAPVAMADDAEQAEAFWGFAQERCIGPQEQNTTPVKDGMKLSAAVVALVPGLTNTSLAWQTQDDLFFLARDTSSEYLRCSVGIYDPGLRRREVVRDVVLAKLEKMVADGRYAETERRGEEERLILRLESSDWREAPIEVILFSDTKIGRLHLSVNELRAED